MFGAHESEIQKITFTNSVLKRYYPIWFDYLQEKRIVIENKISIFQNGFLKIYDEIDHK